MSDGIAYNYTTAIRSYIDIEALLTKGIVQEDLNPKNRITMLKAAMAAGSWMQQNDIAGVETNLVKLLRLFNPTERMVCLLAIPLPKLERLAKSDVIAAWIQECKDEHE
jgi:hypothetical protein